MVNIPDPCIDMELRHIYLNALDAIEAPGYEPITKPKWKYLVSSVAFTLMGAPPMGRGYENAAEQALSAITAWFNDPQEGANRLDSIRNVYLLVPSWPQRKTETCSKNRLLLGGERGSNFCLVAFHLSCKLTYISRYLTPNVDSAAMLRGPRISRREHRDLLENAQTYLYRGAGNTPDLPEQDTDTLMTLTPIILDPEEVDEEATQRANDRMSTRTLRNGKHTDLERVGWNVDFL
jgi:hypothetical protein